MALTLGSHPHRNLNGIIYPIKRQESSEEISLTPEHQKILKAFQNALHHCSLKRYSAECPLSLWVLTGQSLATAVITKEGAPLEWIHTSMDGTPRVYSQTDQLADAIIRGRTQVQRHYGIDPHDIILPYRLTDVEWLARNAWLFP